MIEFLVASTLVLNEPEPVTFWRDIHPITLSKCMPCHDGNNAGPFPLITYEDVSSKATFIHELTSKGIMPPWLPSDKGLSLRGSRKLSDKDLKKMKLWVDAAKPEGERMEMVICPAPPQPLYGHGQTNPELPFTIPAESKKRWHTGILDKQTFVLPIKNNTPLKITSIEYLTTSPQAVQMVGFVFDSTGLGRKLENWDIKPGYEMMGDINWLPSGMHGKIGPGTGLLVLPDGFHWELPADADLIAETHIRPRGKKESLSSSVHLYSELQEGSRPIQEIITMTRRIYIEPEDAAYSVGEEIKIPCSVEVVGITPRAGAACVSMRLTANFPEGNSTILLDLPEWDPHYGETVFLDESFTLPSGTILESRWNYNNSESNPRNPFAPSQLIDLARRTGIANFILHVVPVDAGESENLSHWNLELLRSRQRAIIE